ncbi:hypothetical protein PRZ48_011747 [Zasmidium cellare]|uniref:Uncharacterized protein n=1 Tax=Zasmidium cellare TaxID=395010 RepID=A0ABR0E781_ZASCE|nr:hypothetical protein PRZ48_011747 [Zasmidium cellare]
MARVYAKKMGKNAKRKSGLTRKRSLWPEAKEAKEAAKAAIEKEREEKILAEKKARMAARYKSPREKELEAHRAWLEKMLAPPPEAALEQMPGEYFVPPPPNTTTAPSWAEELLDGLDVDEDSEMPF